MSKCCICRAEYERKYLSQKTCRNSECLKEQRRQVEIGKKKREELRKRKNALKNRSDHISDTDAAFSSYIRYRDRFMPCICCGEPLGHGEVGGNYDAGHYVSRKHMATRWDEYNVHAQRKYCNRHKAGNSIGFREGLIARYGLDEVLRIEARRKEIVNFTTQEIIDIGKYYKAKLKELKQERIAA